MGSCHRPLRTSAPSVWSTEIRKISSCNCGLLFTSCLFSISLRNHVLSYTPPIRFNEILGKHCHLVINLVAIILPWMLCALDSLY